MTGDPPIAHKFLAGAFINGHPLFSPVSRHLPGMGTLSTDWRGHRILELGHIAGWIVGSTLLAAGALLIGYALGLRAGVQRSSLAKDLRISAQEQRIDRLAAMLVETEWELAGARGE